MGKNVALDGMKTTCGAVLIATQNQATIDLVNQPGFNGDMLIAKAYRRDENIYGQKLKSDDVYRFFPAQLGNVFWRVSAGVVLGTIRLFIDRNLQNRGSSMVVEKIEATCNLLCHIENLTQGLADHLHDEELDQHFHMHIAMPQILQCRAQLPNTELLTVARNDYDVSTSSMNGRYIQAR